MSKITRPFSRWISVFAVFSLTLAAYADRIWFDGSRDAANGPPGILLTNNEGYWGASLNTGVTYTYENKPDVGADAYEGAAKSKLGQENLKLINGMMYSAHYGTLGNTLGKPVEIKDKPLVVTFDFKHGYRFTEWDICGGNDRSINVKVEVRQNENDAWTVVRTASGKKATLVRVTPASPVEARYVRITAQQENTTSLMQVFAWGEPLSDETPAFGEVKNDQLVSITGIEKTKFTAEQFDAWQKSLGSLAKQPVIWSKVNTWDFLSNAPILPAVGTRITSEVELITPRNGDEAMAITMTNTQLQKSQRVKIDIGDIYKDGQPVTDKSVEVKIGVFGAVPSRYGNVLSPIFYTDNMPGKGLLAKSVVNAQEIGDYPQITLPGGGSAVFWLTATTHNAAPGLYTTTVRAENGVDVPVRINVLDVTLPKPFHYLNAWSGPTRMFPFEYGDRIDNELAYIRDQGINVWHKLPIPGSIEERAYKLNGKGNSFFHTFILPGEYVGGGWGQTLKLEDLNEADYQKIRNYIHGVVDHTKRLGLDMDEWVGELWDEPARSNMKVFEHLAKFVREVNPEIRIYANPPFWEADGQLRDQDLAYESLVGWYNKYVDVSIPALLAAQWYPRCAPLFNAKRFINGAYLTTTQLSKNEARFEAERYRMAAWDAMNRGWNGWAVFAYYRPMGNPWNALDDSGIESISDYQLVFPGPKGPIPSRPLEGLRLGWQDYCLLSLLKEQKNDQACQLLSDYNASKATMPELRLRALRAAAQK